MPNTKFPSTYQTSYHLDLLIYCTLLHLFTCLKQYSTVPLSILISNISYLNDDFVESLLHIQMAQAEETTSEATVHHQEDNEGVGL